MGIISWIVFGLIAGALAKFIMPGDDPGGFIVTTLIGIVGAVVGGVPAIEVKSWGRAAAVYKRLPEMVKEIRRLRRELDDLQLRLQEGQEE